MIPTAHRRRTVSPSKKEVPQPPLYGFLAAGLGSALADIFSGYAIYAPATFLIKGLMVLAAYCIYNVLNRKINKLKRSC